MLKGNPPRVVLVFPTPSFIESPDSFRLGLVAGRISLDADSFVGNFGVNECMRAVGVKGSSVVNVSIVGEDTEMEMLGSAEQSWSLGGEEERGIVDAEEGNGRCVGLTDAWVSLGEAG